MSFRAPFGKGNNGAVLVDKMVGQEYATVREVAKHLDEIGYLAHNLEAIQGVYSFVKSLHKISIVLGKDNLAQLVELPTNINQDTVIQILGRVIGDFNEVLFMDNITYSIKDSTLWIMWHPTNNVDLEGKTLLVNIYANK